MSRRAFGVAAVVAVALTLGTFGASGFVRVVQMRTEIRAVENDLAVLRAASESLARTIECLRTDPLCIEASAREDLGMARPGETILKFPPKPR